MNSIDIQKQPTPHFRKRLIALIASIFVALASGTPYLYGVYSPQFVKRIGLSASDSSTISIALTLGSGVGGLPGGLIIDRFGAQKSILLGSICIFSGYFAMHKIYEAKYDSLVLICIAIIAAGFGSITSYFATLKNSQANFPRHRGVAGSFPVSCYGMASAMFSLISATFFKGDTGELLEFLAIFCGAVTFCGSFFIKIYLDHDDGEPSIDARSAKNQATVTEEEELSLLSGTSTPHPSATSMSRDESLQGSISFWGIGNRTPRSSVSLQEQEAIEVVENLRNETTQRKSLKDRLSAIPKIFQSDDTKTFLVHYIIVSISSGVGQMYIYSVGFIATAQYYYGKQNPSIRSNNEDHAVQTLQALQVSIISIASFSGRLLAGFISDYIHKKWHIQRLWIVQVTLVLLCIGQYITLVNVNNPHLVSAASAIIGGSYGLIFGTYPAVIADRFGSKNFSSVWGLLCTGPLFSLAVLNHAFGKLYDERSVDGVCYLGNKCYDGAFELALALCSVVFVISLVLIYVQRKV
ncbi:hypothetical protein SBY92_003074 [Candida maltosa Xu316]|uniref:Nodulin-like domain-containing protein n=1 Tax=Candida maltosa (strain Xu316) TaxID=1245528 RepID=M3IP70_CANMX|nr:hypothetical protein G210_1243 [Candida maltosa Xu316]